MSRSFADITEEALQLPTPDQFKLIRTLLENVEAPVQSGVNEAWNAEIERRIAAIDAGIAKGRPFTEVLRDLDERLRRP